ncbi:MAG: hypothetical protein ACTXOO_05910 [Sodalis sp. (in: enterobacteria)]
MKRRENVMSKQSENYVIGSAIIATLAEWQSCPSERKEQYKNG